MKKLYWASFESANYAGYGEQVAVWAHDEYEAEGLVAEYAEEVYYQEDIEQLKEDGHVDSDGMFDGSFGTVKSVEEFGPGHEDWEFYANPQPGCVVYETLGTPE